ncbi:hypothetical protein Tco_0841582 [Tanacetum coccineum]|uniref:Uncharacterized protein n=1 Tax=Tanacetum coccineum TaxID=301880 RepID=A0ABQ5AXF8_9ASTR
MAAPDLLTDIPAISHLLPSDHSELESSEIPSSLDSHETSALWRARVATRPPLSDSSLPSSSISIPFTEIAATFIIPALSIEFTATPHVLSTTPIHVTSTPFTSTMPSQASSVRLSRKRRRSPVTLVTTAAHTPAALTLVLADLLPIRKRFRGSTFDYEASVEEGIREDIMADAGADAQIGVKAEAKAEESDGDTIEIGVYVVHPEPDTLAVFPMSTIVVKLVKHEEAIHGMCKHLVEMPTQRFEEIEEELRVQRERADIA